MFDLDVYAVGLAASLSMAVGAWLVSLARHDVSFIDSLWSLFFLLMATTYIAAAPAVGERSYLVFFLVGVWAVRLSAFLARRNWGQPEDRRYREIRRSNEPGFELKSLYLVFGLQAILAWILSLPLMVAIGSTAPLGWPDYAAVTLWLFGLFFESIGDEQLAQFNDSPRNQGRVMDRGLWRYTRHPNYFGEACIWWAFWLFSLAEGTWWTIISPLLTTYLLLRVSGVTLLEKDITHRRPLYGDYISRTNTFIPGPPRRASAHNTGSREEEAPWDR